MLKEAREYDLEDRLVAYAALVIELTESLPNSRAGNHIQHSKFKIQNSTFNILQMSNLTGILPRPRDRVSPFEDEDRPDSLRGRD